MGFLNEFLNHSGSNAELNTMVSMRAYNPSPACSQWSQMTPDLSSVARIVDIHHFIPAANRSPAYYLVISDGDRFAIAITAESELTKWKSVMPEPGDPPGISIRAAVITTYGMVPLWPASLNRNLLHYIHQINGMDQVLHVANITFQGRGPILRVPKMSIRSWHLLSDDDNAKEPVQHDSFYDLSQRVNIFVGMRARKFAPIEDSDDEDEVDDISDVEMNAYMMRKPIGILPSDFEIPASIPPCSGGESSCFDYSSGSYTDNDSDS